jgi:serine/threonine protein kinase
MLQRFSGPYIVNLIDSDTVKKNRGSTEALLLLDYCPGGHLLDRLKRRNNKVLPHESIFRIFGQLLSGLNLFHLNNPPIVHRDLKLENILFGQVCNITILLLLYRCIINIVLKYLKYHCTINLY